MRLVHQVGKLNGEIRKGKYTAMRRSWNQLQSEYQMKGHDDVK